MNSFNEGDYVTFEVMKYRHGGRKVGKILSKRFTRRGGVEISVSVLNDRGEPESWRIKNPSILKPASKKEIAVVKKADGSLKAHQEKIEKVQQQRHERKIERAEENYSIMKELIDEGVLGMFLDRYDQPSNVKVKIQFNEGIYPRDVVDVRRTGVVIKGRKKSIPWKFVKGFVYEEQKVPLKNGISEDRMKEINKKGFTLIGHMGSEFIESSTAISKTPAGLFKRGATYDGPSHQIYFDSNANMYWRQAGCFD
jgi:hypothetical protein